MSSNQITLVGNVVKSDPELRYTAGGQALASFTVVHSDRYKDKQGEWVDGDPSFFDVTAWGALGENVAASIQKGMYVIIVGKMRQRKWQTKEGDNRYAWSLVADHVAPSLRWATAHVEQTTRDHPRLDNEPIYGDEEPF